MAEKTSAFIREMQDKEGKSYKPKRWQLVVKVAQDNPNFVADTREDKQRHEFIGRGANRKPNPHFVADTRKASEKRPTVWVQKTKTFAGTKSAATKALSAFQASLEAEADKPTVCELTVPDAVSRFLETHDVEGSTMTTYKASAKHIENGFSGVRVSDLTPKMVREWLAKLAKAGYSLSVQGKAYRLLNLVLKHLVLDEEIERNVCDAVKAPKRDKPDPNALTNENREKLFKYLNDMEPTALVTGAMTALMMGLREAEICGLQWRDIDLANGMLTVRQAIGFRKGGTYVKAPKTASSERTLPIPDALLNMLTARSVYMHNELAEVGLQLSDEQFSDLFVIGYIDGRYKNPTMLGREWHSLSEALNLKGTKRRICTFHDLRHSWATVAVSNNTDVKSVASFLGHSNVATTLNIYASSDSDALKAAAANMDRSYAFEGKEQGDVVTLTRNGTEG